ncbi:MAG: hypothetical protein KDD55_13805 [Bdellovibrionales bacterium]|nr:hypothetical protein [Bdellovibrionales bacterium]
MFESQYQYEEMPSYEPVSAPRIDNREELEEEVLETLSNNRSVMFYRPNLKKPSILCQIKTSLHEYVEYEISLKKITEWFPGLKPYSSYVTGLNREQTEYYLDHDGLSEVIGRLDIRRHKEVTAIPEESILEYCLFHSAGIGGHVVLFPIPKVARKKSVDMHPVSIHAFYEHPLSTLSQSYHVLSAVGRR